jgi:hypothetical protein
VTCFYVNAGLSERSPDHRQIEAIDVPVIIRQKCFLLFGFPLETALGFNPGDDSFSVKVLSNLVTEDGAADCR